MVKPMTLSVAESDVKATPALHVVGPALSGQKRYTRIEGAYYEISSIVASHPGGQIIEAAVGIDATCLFATHHSMCVSGGDKVARAWLAKCRLRAGSAEESAAKSAVLSSVAYERSALYDELVAEIKPHVDRRQGTVLFGLEAAFWIAVLIGASYVRLTQSAVWAAALTPLAAVMVALGTMHEATHGGTSSKGLNWLLNLFAVALGTGGTQRWRFSHTRHHALTNDPHGDPDVFPLEKFIRYLPSVPLAWYHRYQGVYAWLAYSMSAHVFSLEAFSANAHPTYKELVYIPAVHGSRVLLERLCGVVAFALRVGLPLYMCTWRSLLVCELMVLLCGLFMGCVFQVNHWTARLVNGMPAAEAKHGADWAALQITSSNDFAVDSVFWTHVTGGLNYQIEHHLFPTLNHWHYPTVGKALRALCQRRNIAISEYATLGEALLDHQRLLEQLSVARRVEEPKW
jgi:fatty acid desaturase